MATEILGDMFRNASLQADHVASEQRVILVDLDPQGNATTGFGIEKSGLYPTIYHVLLGGEPGDKALVSTPLPHLRLLPSDIDLVIATAFGNGRLVCLTLCPDGGAPKLLQLRRIGGPHRAHDRRPRRLHPLHRTRRRIRQDRTVARRRFCPADRQGVRACLKSRLKSIISSNASAPSSRSTISR